MRYNTRLVWVVCLATAIGCAADKHAGGADAGAGKLHDGGSSDASAALDAARADAANGGSHAGAGGASGAAGVGGAGGNSADADVDDAGTCSSVTISSNANMVTTPGNVLMIFDRSGSMNTDWNGKPRWQAAGEAMIAALTPVQDELTIGTVFFPSDAAMVSCNVAAITDATQLPFQAGAQAITKLQTGGTGGVQMYQPGIGQTPTLAALQVADAALSAASLTGTIATILITDGDPNCNWDETMAVQIVTAWAGSGIKTYVLGVPGVGGTGETTLNTVAVAGGTTAYIAASDALALQNAVHSIAQGTVSVQLDSCTITLAKAASPASDLHMVLTKKNVDYDVPRKFAGDASASWTLSSNGKSVHVAGTLCTKLQGGSYQKLRFEEGCVDLPTLSKPVP